MQTSRLRLTRRGGALTEVLVAIAIFALGIVSVVQLFPIGVIKVREAVVDHRTNLLGNDAANVLHAERIADRLAPIYHPIQDFSPTAPADDWYDVVITGLTPPDERDFLNIWAVHPEAAGTTPPARIPGYNVGDPETNPIIPDGGNVTPDSYPILIDPWLYHLSAGSAGAAGVHARNWPPVGNSGYMMTGTVPQSVCLDVKPTAGAGSTRPFLGVPVVSTLNMFRAGSGSPAIAEPLPNYIGGQVGLPFGTAPTTAQRAFLNRWFGSLNDVYYDERNPVVPTNPAANETPPPAPDRYATLGATATGSRDTPYTWAAMLQRPLNIADITTDPMTGAYTATATNPFTSRFGPAASYQDWEYSGSVRYLCFHKRSLSQPYVAIEGCFYPGSRRVTLSWPQAAGTRVPANSVPKVKIGTWLCELSMTGGRQTGNYTGANVPGGTTAGYHRYRNSMNFYQVTSVEDPVLNADGRIYQMVDIDRVVTDGDDRTYGGGGVGAADLRKAPGVGPAGTVDLYPGTFDTTWYPITRSTAGADQATATGGATDKRITYYPVIIFDGLVHVY